MKKVLTILLLAVPLTALAYIGPGGGLSALGALLALLLTLAVAFLGFVWYPLRRMRRQRRERANETAAATVKSSSHADD